MACPLQILNILKRERGHKWDRILFIIEFQKLEPWSSKEPPLPLRGFLSGKPTNHFFTSMQEGLQLACFVYQNGSTMAFIFPGMSNPWKWSYQEKQHVKRKEKQKSKEPFPFF
ncbi:hypothetical protein POPTR_009G067901v4 [Populus trichocarpa]|uniref:Uncharacterized protein n=1 Tax=Populus trichocarpa TaxID=3694 RepID=A0ACC0SGZ7_POPTR|nr:hypothetical protein POPTR_009G067901v4 [Populus trichocarpa]